MYVSALLRRFPHTPRTDARAHRKYSQLRLYSRDDTLSATSHLSSIPLTAPIHLISLHDNSLLLYTTANTFYHFLIVPTEREVELRLCGSISFEGVVQVPGRVRAMSWLIPLAQKSACLAASA